MPSFTACILSYVYLFKFADLQNLFDGKSSEIKFSNCSSSGMKSACGHIAHLATFQHVTDKNSL